MIIVRNYPLSVSFNSITAAIKVSVHYASFVFTSYMVGYESVYSFQNMASVALPYIFPNLLTVKFGIFVAAPAIGYSVVSHVCSLQYDNEDRSELCNIFNKYITSGEKPSDFYTVTKYQVSNLASSYLLKDIFFNDASFIKNKAASVISKPYQVKNFISSTFIEKIGDIIQYISVIKDIAIPFSLSTIGVTATYGDKENIYSNIPAILVSIGVGKLIQPLIYSSGMPINFITSPKFAIPAMLAGSFAVAKYCGTNGDYKDNLICNYIFDKKVDTDENVSLTSAVGGVYITSLIAYLSKLIYNSSASKITSAVFMLTTIGAVEKAFNLINSVSLPRLQSCYKATEGIKVGENICYQDGQDNQVFCYEVSKAEISGDIICYNKNDQLDV